MAELELASASLLADERPVAPLLLLLLLLAPACTCEDEGEDTIWGGAIVRLGRKSLYGNVSGSADWTIFD